MGRATIVSGGTDGRYTIDLDYGVAQRDARVAKLTATINELEDRKLWQQGQVDGFQGGLESLQPEFDALVHEYVALANAVPQNRAAMDAKKTQIDKKTAEIIKQQAWLDSAKADLGMTEARIKAATLERGAIQTAEVSEQRQAWCADLTETATGPVATLEIPGESALILIQPGAPEPTAIHGALAAREIQSPEQVYWNAAVLPGWQKFLPTYRWGTITALNQSTDKCDLELAPAQSSAQQLNVNPTATLQNVTIRYMECNSGVFNVGDRVVVQFEGNDWARPVVVGFVDNPRACGGAALYCIPADTTAPYGWSPPVKDAEGAPINAGKGSVALLGNAAGATELERDGTNRTAGVASTFTKGSATALTSRVIRGVRADVAGLPSSGPTELGNDDDPMSFSSAGRAMLEWVSTGGAYVVTFFGDVKVNGKDNGRPSGTDSPLKAFIPQTSTGEPVLIVAVTVIAGYGAIRLHTRPLLGDANVAWDLLAEISFAGMGADPAVEYPMLRKIAVHPQATECALWFASGAAGIGHLAIDTKTGSHAFTPAPVSFGRDPEISSIHLDGTYVYHFDFKFSIDYVGGSLSYATLSGRKTHQLVISNPGFSEGTQETTINEVITADFWGVEVEISDYHWHEIRTQTGDMIDRERSASLDSKRIYYYGGPGAPILYTAKNYGNTVHDLFHVDNEFLIGRCSPGDDACFIAMGLRRTERVPAMQVLQEVLHNGQTITLSETETPEYAAEYFPLFTTLPDLASGIQVRWDATYQEGEWARTDYYPYTYPNTAAGIQQAFRTLFVPETVEDLTYISPSYHSTPYFLSGSVNLRHINGFAVFSNPSLVYGDESYVENGTDETPTSIARFPVPPTLKESISQDYTLWNTYCSDPSALDRYALDLSVNPPVPGRLKYLQITSAS